MNTPIEPSPLFVPSFSSKGNLLLKDDSLNIISDNNPLMLALDIRLLKSYLVSAYDIYYGFMPNEPDDYPITEYLFIDSGGYEINDSYDLSENNRYNYKVFDWSEEMMSDVYCKFYKSKRFEYSKLILTTFDCFADYETQLKNALVLKGRFENATINFLIKISGAFDDLLHFLDEKKVELSDIAIIGFTDKELGETYQERIINVTRISSILDAIGWQGNLHIFGGLEPNISPLFCCAGASIIDGLSWQKIRYSNNGTLYSPRHYDISKADIDNRFDMMVDNLTILAELPEKIHNFIEANGRIKIRDKLIQNLQNNSSINLLLENMRGE